VVVVGDGLWLVWRFALFGLLASVLLRRMCRHREGEWILRLGQFLQTLGDHQDPTVERGRGRERREGES
jgi:hypothetical protein